jgi:hypothetical protein
MTNPQSLLVRWFGGTFIAGWVELRSPDTIAPLAKYSLPPSSERRQRTLAWENSHKVCKDLAFSHYQGFLPY